MTERFTDGVEEGAADFAIADLSVTSARNEAVEFSTPWMTLGISIIFQKPRQAPPGLMSFLSPFTVEVWIYISLGNMIIKLYAKVQKYQTKISSWLTSPFIYRKNSKWSNNSSTEIPNSSPVLKVSKGELVLV